MKREKHEGHSGHAPHDEHCQCISCKLTRYKKKHGENWVQACVPDLLGCFSSPTSLAAATIGGSLLLYCGYQCFKQWQQTSYASLSSKTPTSRVVTTEPNVLLNNATETFYSHASTDPSLGIIYFPLTGIYRITTEISGSFPTSATTPNLLTVTIVKNALPNDSAAVLRTVQITLSPGALFQVSFDFIAHTNQDDYIQVFGALQSQTNVTIETYDMTCQLLRSTVTEADGSSEI